MPRPEVMSGETPARETALRDDGFLRDIWYFAMPAADLARGAMRARTLLGEPVLLGRVADGSVFPTSIGVPPQLSIYAIGLHVGRSLII